MASFFISGTAYADVFNFDNTSSFNEGGAGFCDPNDVGAGGCYNGHTGASIYEQFQFNLDQYVVLDSITLYLDAKWVGSFGTDATNTKDVIIQIQADTTELCDENDPYCDANTYYATGTVPVSGSSQPVTFDNFWSVDYYGTVFTPAAIMEAGTTSTISIQDIDGEDAIDGISVFIAYSTSTDILDVTEYAGSYTYNYDRTLRSVSGAYGSTVLPAMIWNAGSVSASNTLALRSPSSTLALVPTFSCNGWGLFSWLCTALVWTFVPDTDTISQEMTVLINTASSKFPFSYVASVHSAFTDSAAPTSTSDPLLTISLPHTTTSTLGDFMPSTWEAFSTSTVSGYFSPTTWSFLRSLMALAIYFETISLIYYGAMNLTKGENSTV